MEKKYKLLEDEIITITDDNGDTKTLYRIESLQDIREDVSIGTKGGFIEKEDNLSHFGGCWVYDDARVYNDAKILDDAIVYDRATVSEHAICGGLSQVYNKANISGFAEVKNDARVYDNAIVNGCAVIDGHARVFGNSTVTGLSIISDMSQVFDECSIQSANITKDAQIGGNVIINGDTIIGDKALIKNQNDFISIAGIGLGSEVLTAFRTVSKTTNIIYSGGFIGSIGDFTKYISEPSIFGSNTTEELRSIIKLILNHMATDFSSDIIEIENNILNDPDDESDDILDDADDYMDDNEIDYDALDTVFETFAGAIVREDEEMMAED